MDIVLGVSMEPAAVRMVLIEGASADGVTVEEDSIEVAAASTSGDGESGASYAPGQVIAGLIGTREGVLESGYQLTSTGVTWTDPSEVLALRAELALHDAGGVMLVSPLLAAAALAQSVGSALGYEHIAMMFVEVNSATLAVVEIADGSIVDLHRHSLRDVSVAAGLVTMVAGLDAPSSRADGVFLIGCGVDIVEMKPALEAATSLVVSVPEEPQMALARGAALASANAPLFSSSTSALAYALDPGTGEVNPRALAPSYLDVCAMAGVGEGALAYSAVADETGAETGVAPTVAAEPETEPKRKPLALVSGTLAGVALVAAAMLIVSLASSVRPTAAQQSGMPQSIGTPALQAPATELPAQVLLPIPSSAPAAPPPVEVAAPAPPPPVVQPPPQTVTRPAQNPAYLAPAPRRTPTRQAAPPVEAPIEQAPAPAPAPAAVAPPAPAPPAAPTPVMTMYLHLPFVSIPIPINPPPPPPPPAPAEPGP